MTCLIYSKPFQCLQFTFLTFRLTHPYSASIAGSKLCPTYLQVLWSLKNIRPFYWLFKTCNNKLKKKKRPSPAVCNLDFPTQAHILLLWSQHHVKPLLKSVIFLSIKLDQRLQGGAIVIVTRSFTDYMMWTYIFQLSEQKTPRKLFSFCMWNNAF